MNAFDVQQPRQFPEPFSAADLAHRPYPEQRWIVPGVWPADTLAGLDGPGETGKSTLGALQLGAAVAVGGQWLGFPVQPGSVLYVSAEDPEPVIHRRLADICVGLDCGLEDLRDFKVWDLADVEPEFAVPDGRGGMRLTPLWEAFAALVLRTRPTLVVLDSRTDFFVCNENDRALVRQFTGHLRRLGQRAGSLVLLLGHPSLNRLDGSSGSTGWRNGMRGAWTLDWPPQVEGELPDPDARVLIHRKNSFGPRRPEMRLRRGAGIFHLVGSAAPATPLARAAEGRRVEAAFLRLLAAYEAEGRGVSSNPGPTYAPRIFAADARADGIKAAGFRAAMDRLFGAGRILQVTEGRPGKERGRLVMVDEP